MFNVNGMQVELVGPTRLVSEASTMGLPPGVWPDWIAVTDRNVGFLFGHPQKSYSVGGDVTKVTYQSVDGYQLVVFND